MGNQDTYPKEKIMSLVENKTVNFASYRGSPTAGWEHVRWGFEANNIKVVVLPTSTTDLEMSIDGSNTHAILPAPETGQNPMVYDFDGLVVNRLSFKNVGAKVEIYAYGGR